MMNLPHDYTRYGEYFLLIFQMNRKIFDLTIKFNSVGHAIFVADLMRDNK